MNLKLRDEAPFFAEYQNEPLLVELNADDLTADQIAERINRLERCISPIGVEYVTMFIKATRSNRRMYASISTIHMGAICILPSA